MDYHTLIDIDFYIAFAILLVLSFSLSFGDNIDIINIYLMMTAGSLHYSLPATSLQHATIILLYYAQ